MPFTLKFCSELFRTAGENQRDSMAPSKSKNVPIGKKGYLVRAFAQSSKPGKGYLIGTLAQAQKPEKTVFGKSTGSVSKGLEKSIW